MKPLLSKYVNRTEFKSYEDFYQNLKITVPEHFNFAYDVVDVYAENDPDRLAIVWCDDHGNEDFISFGDLRRRCNRCANYFRSLGIGRGDPVMLILKGRYEFWPCLLALHKIGAVAIPATHMLKDHDIVYRIELAKVKAIVCVNTDDLFEQVESAQRQTGDTLKIKICVGGSREGWHDYDAAMPEQSINFPPLPFTERPLNKDIMLLYFTSGTSGFPKMVQHGFAYPLAHILTAHFWQNTRDGGLHYTVADTGWAKAVWGKIYGQWLSGSTVFVYDQDRFSAPALMAKVAQYKVTTFCAPPTIYRFLIKEDLSLYDLSALKYCVVAGEPLNPEVYHRFLEKTGIRLMEAYGQTELVVTTATWPWMAPKPGSMGRPSPGYEIELHGPDDKPVEIGEEGELVIKTSTKLPPGIFGGYYKDADMTDGVWHDGFYHTGDVAWQDPDGYLWYVGRSDDVIKSSGYRIGPFEVESVLMQHPAVLECAITGAPDPTRGQVVKATIVLSKGYTAGDELKSELQRFVKNATAPYKYPRVIEFVTALPKTISGKIRRVEIRSQEHE